MSAKKPKTRHGKALRAFALARGKPSFNPKNCRCSRAVSGRVTVRVVRGHDDESSKGGAA